MAQSGFTPIQLYFSTTGAAVPSAGNLANGELAINITDGRLFYKDNSGTVQVLATKAGANGDVVGPASATDNALVRFDNISGKLVQNSVGILDDSGNLSGIAALTTSGALTLNGGTANGVAYLNGSKVLTTGSALTYNGTTLTADTSSTSAANLRIENGSFNRVGAFQLTANGVQFDAFDQNSTSAQRSFMWLSGGSEQMRLTSTGLGIGTSSPSVRLMLEQAANSAPVTLLRLNNSGTTGGGPGIASRISFTAGATALGFIQGSNFASGAAGLQLSGDGTNAQATLDSVGNLGLGVTPSAWSGYTGFQVKSTSVAGIGTSDNGFVGSNVYYNGSAFTYMNSTTATLYRQLAGSHSWHTAPSGTAGAAISFTQAMTLDASGNLGVGTTSPTSFGAGAIMQTVAGTTSYGGYLGSTNSVTVQMWADQTGSGTMGTRTNHPLLLTTNNTERARITSGGNFGIGTSSPAERLQVAGSIRVTSNANDFNVLGGQFDFAGDSTRIAAYNASGSTIQFYTNASGGNVAERARIDSSGNLLVGKTAVNTTAGLILYAPGTTGGAGRIDFTKSASGTFTACNFGYNASTVGSISYTDTATAYNTSSDYRLKEDIQPMTGALAKVAALKPCAYKWKADGSDGEGFIAHELQAVVPQCVTGEKDAVDAEGKPVYQGIDTSFLVATLTAALQEAHGLIKDQSAAITALTARVAALESN